MNSSHLLGAYPVCLQSTASIAHIVVTVEGQQLTAALSLDEGEQRVLDHSPAQVIHASVQHICELKQVELVRLSSVLCKIIMNVNYNT